MNKTIALIAAAATLVVANTSLAPVAEAGGKRLHFGFPLGSFTARECGSCGSSSSYHHSGGGYAAKKAAARREAIAEAQARKAAARRAAIAEARAEQIAARRAAIAKAKADARRAAIAEARAEKAAARRAAAIAEARRKARLARLKAEQPVVEKAEVTTETPNAVPLPVRADIEEGSVTVGEPKVILSNSKSTGEEKVAAAPVEIVPVPVAKVAQRKPTDCKKYVPSAGLTITVPCQ